MINIVINIYRFLFLRKFFFKFNKLLLSLSLRGIGILNFENEKLSGEGWFLREISKRNRHLVALDIGANIGRYSSTLKALCPEASIYAFEPHPKSFLRLQASAYTSGYTAINLGCSNIEGKLKLYDYKGANEGSEHASLYKDVIEILHNGEVISWDVDLTTVDSFVKQNDIPQIHLLKIDTEGNELKVLQGAKETIEKGFVEMIHFEFNEMNLMSRTFFRDFYQALPEYYFYRMLPDGLVPLGSYNSLFHEIFAFQNIVAIHRLSQFRP